MTDQMAATVAGASTAAIGKLIEMILGRRPVLETVLKTVEILITGYIFALFLAHNVSILIEKHMGITVFVSTVAFLLACFAVPIKNGIGTGLSKLFRKRF
jgi:hypothetical protein